MRNARGVEIARLILICLCVLMMCSAEKSQADANHTQPDFTLIHDIQGSSASSSVVNQTVRVQAVVTADYQGNQQLGGFYIQEEDQDADANDRTSEGIFVYCDPDGIYTFRSSGSDQPHPALCGTDVEVGNLVTVEGVVQETFGQTQIDARSGSITKAPQNVTLPTPVTLDLTHDLVQAGNDRDDFYKAYEGMLVTIIDTLTVAEYFQLSRYGEVVLYQGGRPYQYTHLDDTPTDAEHQLYMDDLTRRRLILDDDSDVENLPIVRSPQIIFLPQPGGFSTGVQGINYFRGGDTITSLTGILGYGFSEWRIRPILSSPAVFTPANPRADVSPQPGGTLTISSFNVLNYFTTLGARGANSSSEFQRQADKIVAAMASINADVFGLMEIENNGTAVADLVNRLNAVVGDGVYDFINTGVIGTDEIAVAVLYKQGTVEPIGTTAVLDAESFTNPRNTSTPKNRPAIAQTFRELATGESVTVVVNHLKSKGSGCGAGDDDPLQGNCNGTRADAAAELVNWLETDPTGTGETDILIIGDLNAYAGEDPIDAIRAGGGSFEYHDLQGGVGSEHYSYVFNGQLGYLDQALASDSLLPQVTGADEWHINADEVPLFDYNDDIRDPGEARFDEEPDGNPLYEANPFRASDHDPVVVGLNLRAGTAEPTSTSTVTATPTVTETPTPTPTDASPSGDLPSNVFVQVNEGDITIVVCAQDADASPVSVTVETGDAHIHVIYSPSAEQCSGG